MLSIVHLNNGIEGVSLAEFELVRDISRNLTDNNKEWWKVLLCLLVLNSAS